MPIPSRNLAALCALFAPLVGEPVEVDFAALSDFVFTPGMTLPAHVTKLDKQTVRISGFMMREDGGDGPTEYFMLVNDACGCQGTPKLNEILFCAMPQGQTATLRPGTVHVVGTLYVGEVEEDGATIALYCVDVDQIEP